MKLNIGYLDAKFRSCRLSRSSFNKQLGNTMMTSSCRHFVLLGFEICIFDESGYRLSINLPSFKSLSCLDYFFTEDGIRHQKTPL